MVRQSNVNPKEIEITTARRRKSCPGVTIGMKSTIVIELDLSNRNPQRFKNLSDARDCFVEFDQQGDGLERGTLCDADPTHARLTNA